MLPLLLLALPLAEIAVFVMVGSEIGALATIALVIATTILGAVLLRVQGFGALTRIRSAMEAGQSPGRDLVHGVMIVLAGLLLIVPGFITDLLGLLLFLPPLRELAWRLVARRIVVVDIGTAGAWRRSRQDRTIDLDAEDYEREDARPPRRPPHIEDDR